MKPIHLAILVAASLVLGACGEASVEHFEPPPATPEADDFTLATGVMPLLRSPTNHCISCHNATAMTSGLNLDGTPTEVRDNLIAGGVLESAAYGEDVNLTFPEQSLFAQAGLKGANFGHASQKFFENEDDFSYVTILGWIRDGALEN